MLELIRVLSPRKDIRNKFRRLRYEYLKSNMESVREKTLSLQNMPGQNILNVANQSLSMIMIFRPNYPGKKSKLNYLTIKYESICEL